MGQVYNERSLRTPRRRDGIESFCDSNSQEFHLHSTLQQYLSILQGIHRGILAHISPALHFDVLEGRTLVLCTYLPTFAQTREKKSRAIKSGGGIHKLLVV